MALRRTGMREWRTAVKAQLEGLSIMAGKTPEPYGARIPKQRAPRKPSGKVPERLVLREVLRMLRAHPKVAVCWRMQSGLFEIDDRPIRVGIVGMPDVIGMLKGGQLFAVECKSEDGKLTESQAYWLETIRHFGGRAGVARSGNDAVRIIE